MGLVANFNTCGSRRTGGVNSSVKITRHAALGIDIHLFVRDTKLAVGKAAPFTYHGRVRYQSHQGSKPMSIVFGLQSGAD